MSSKDNSLKESGVKKALFKKKVILEDKLLLGIGIFLLCMGLFLGVALIPFELNWIQSDGGWTLINIWSIGMILFIICTLFVIGVVSFIFAFGHSSFNDDLRHYGIYRLSSDDESRNSSTSGGKGN